MPNVNLYHQFFFSIFLRVPEYGLENIYGSGATAGLPSSATFDVEQSLADKPPVPP